MKSDLILLYFFKLYSLLWHLVLPFLKKNLRLKQGINQRTSYNHLKKADIWIQAASAGEAYLAVEIIKNLSFKNKTKVLVTSTTSQGMDILKDKLLYQDMGILKEKVFNNYLHHNLIVNCSWFPFDIPKLMDKAVLKVNPKLMILLESEMWPALLYSFKKNNIKVFIINARISNKSFKNYMRTCFIWQNIAPDKIFATTKKYKKRFKQLFANSQVKLMPNIKFDSISDINNDFSDVNNDFIAPCSTADFIKQNIISSI